MEPRDLKDWIEHLEEEHLEDDLARARWEAERARLEQARRLAGGQTEMEVEP